MIAISTRNAERSLKELRRKLSDKQVASATRMALNESIRSGKTHVNRAIRDYYNISNSRINDSNPKKGLSLKLATNSNLEAVINAGHIPINLSEASPRFTGDVIAQQVKIKGGKVTKGRTYRRSRSVISVEVKRGQRKKLASAFTIGVATHVKTGQQFTTPAIFARGKKGKPKFNFMKPRLPIDSLSTVSVAAASMNTQAQAKAMPAINNQLTKRLEHHMKRMIKNV